MADDGRTTAKAHFLSRTMPLIQHSRLYATRLEWNNIRYRKNTSARSTILSNIKLTDTIQIYR
jgi:hypothetical protein